MQRAIELEIALHAVSKATRLCQRVRTGIEAVRAIHKSDRSPVTVADYGSQAVMIHVLQGHFATDPIVAEESADLLRKDSSLRQTVLEWVQTEVASISETELLDIIDTGRDDTPGATRFWTMDPIDGTKGFLRGDQYAVALALIEQGQVTLGVLGCPAFPPQGSPEGMPVQDDEGSLFHAVRGQGSWRTGLKSKADGKEADQIHTDHILEPADARFCESVERAHTSHETHQRIAGLLSIHRNACRIDSQVKYAAVARGDASIYLRLPRDSSYREKIWDHAAGALLVEEAGGRVSDARGNALDFSVGPTLDHNRGILATNGILHEQVLEAIQIATRKDA